MALEEYARKRDFNKTPEPGPDRRTSTSRSLSYLIQKHDASRIHYDFRLECDGVLWSWAVPKGPSLNPKDKRLAVRTEDHPLSYGTFEGTIPKGQYGGGTVMLWDEGTWVPQGDPQAALKKGHLAFELRGGRLQGGWNLVRMPDKGSERENWLLIKERDDAALESGKNEEFLVGASLSIKSKRSMEDIANGREVRSQEQRKQAKKPTSGRSKELPRLMKQHSAVQLATLVAQAPEGDEWLHEIKFDGYRLLGFIADGSVRLRTRNGQDWTERFPGISRAMQALDVKAAVLDMEAVILDAEGKSSFQALQAALGEGGDSDKIVAYVFDLLELDGEDLTQKPLLERKEKLKQALPKGKAQVLHFSDHVQGQGSELFAKACKSGLEGIVSKRADAPYSTGRGKAWVKIKCGARQELLILGYSAARSGGRALGALYLGYEKGKQLGYAGKVGTGFSMKSAKELTTRLNKLSVSEALLPRAETGGLPASEYKAIHWVKPELLCEVAFTEWTQDGRIRHPSFQGLRDDKNADKIEPEVPAEMASSGVAKGKAMSGSLVLHGIKITNRDRVISETGQITKGALADYYAAVAPLLMPGIVRRPLSLLRCPSGFDGNCFYQRNPGKGLGADVHPYGFKHKGKAYEYLYIEDEKGLIELVQMGAVEIHPWGSTVDRIDSPDRMIFDLDPAPDVPFDALKLAAEELRVRLKKKRLKSYLKCTGGHGLHVTAPLDGSNDWPTVKEFAAAMANEMVAAAPAAYVATMSKAKRTGKIFIDYFRNDYTATAIADYAVRARPGAPVAVPLEWKELDGLKSSNQFSLDDVLKRVKGKRSSADIPAQAIPAK